MSAPTNQHFDCLKNTLPPNFTNNMATAYYNRAFWKRCPCEYGPSNPCKELADKWNPVTTETSRWTKGCSPCSSYYNGPSRYNYTYNPNDCGDRSGRWYPVCHPPQYHDYCGCGNNACNKCFPCSKCQTHCQPGCPCHKFQPCEKIPMQSYIVNNRCSDCTDVAIMYRMTNEQYDCDNIVELRIPVGGSKEKYLASRFSPEFMYANRFQCAVAPTYNHMPNNVIDNRRQEEFTPSTQEFLTKRGINNYLKAEKLINDGQLLADKQTYQVNSILNERLTSSRVTPITGLLKDDIATAYFT